MRYPPPRIHESAAASEASYPLHISIFDDGMICKKPRAAVWMSPWPSWGYRIDIDSGFVQDIPAPRNTGPGTRTDCKNESIKQHETKHTACALSNPS